MKSRTLTLAIMIENVCSEVLIDKITYCTENTDRMYSVQRFAWDEKSWHIINRPL